MALSNFWLVDECPLAMTFENTLRFKTGTWRHFRPYFQEKAAPCQAACPAGEDIPRYMELAAAGNFAQALEVIKEENPLPGVCGRVCPHPCERDCNRAQFDQSLSIKEIERFLADQGPEACSGGPEKGDGFPVAVVGSGPAGLSCAYFLSRLGHKVTVFEAASQPGGVLRFGIPAYRLPRQVLDKEIRSILSGGVSLKLHWRLGQNLSWEDLNKYDAVFLACGLSASRSLNLPGEEAGGVLRGLEFLKKVNRGQFKSQGDHAVIVGGGDVAVDATRCALRLGYAKVTLVSLEERDSMPAVPVALEEAEEEGVELINGAQINKIITSQGRVVAVEAEPVRFQGFDDQGQPITEKTDNNFSLPADLLVMAVGQGPNISGLPASITLGNRGLIVDAWCRTSIPGLFAGGDLAQAPATVASAISSGKRAALAMDSYLRANGQDITASIIGQGQAVSFTSYLNGQRRRDLTQVVPYSRINTDYFETAPRQQGRKLPGQERATNFAEVASGLPSAEASQEASRCFNCGLCTRCDNCYIFCPDLAVRKDSSPDRVGTTSEKDGQLYTYQIDYDFCKGCNICVEECPRDAVSSIVEDSSPDRVGTTSEKER